MKKSLDLSSISVLSELDKIGWEYIPAGDNEIKCRCPVHDDANPSVNINVEKMVWKCHAASCGAKGDIVTFLAYALKCERKTVLADLSTRYDLEILKTVNPEVVEDYHSKIAGAGPLLKALRDRGVTDDMIRRARLGYHDGRIIIPVFDRDGRIINLRKYLPGAPGPEKMRNIRGYKTLALYQPRQTEYDKVWICGGEMKALVAADTLNKISVGAVSVTGSEGSWDPEFNQQFKDKVVYICMDIDAGGKSAAKNVAAHLCYVASEVYIINLPLDPDEYPKGDLNDWVVSANPTEDDFAEVMAEAKPFTLSLDTEKDLEVIEVRLAKASSAECVSKRVKTEAVVTQMDTTPFLVPKDVGVSCSKDQPNCSFCPVRPMDQDETTGKVQLTVKGSSAGILNVINAPSRHQREAVREALRIPPCKVASFTIRSYYDVRDVCLSPQLEIDGEENDHVVQRAFVVDSEVDLNSPYEFTGRVYPHPKNQQAILLLDEVEQGQDSLSTFEDEGLERLDVFKAKDIPSKLDDIYTDLEANVTNIYFRRDLHLALDLTWFSPLLFEFEGKTQKGWVNTLIIGDSSQGKSETANQLMRHYRLGVRHDCKNASAAGLLGGAQKISDRWYISWGIIPTHDRRLVVLEEVKGTAVEELGKLTDMRSSGIAEISKIEKRKAHARTRLVFVSNPRSNRMMSSFNFGVEAMHELIGSPEDIRRFDLAVVTSATQVDVEQINRLQQERPEVEHRFTSDLCHKHVLWAWTRTKDQIRFEDDALEACMSRAIDLCNSFTESLPLVDKGTMRYKIARLSASLAMRLFSTLPDNRSVVLVRREHVEFIFSYLKRMYSEPIFGYADYSRAQEFATTVLDRDVIERNLKATKYPKDLVEHLLHAREIVTTDIADWCEVDTDEARKLLSLLVRKHALYRRRRWYEKTSEFIELLKTMRHKGLRNEAETEGEEF